LDVKTSIFEIQKKISELSKEDIFAWAKIVKSDTSHFKSASFLIEALAVIKRAVFLDTGFHLTDVQVISSVVMLNTSEGHGRLIEVETGGGKSIIVCVLAIIKALQGETVDIVTSSPVLAQRDAVEKAKLFQMFGLSCSDNSDKAIYIKGGKDCYKKDIVYGEAAQFQFDILRDEYSKLGTLCGRKRETCIVDEVDSLLVDDSSKIARLATTVPGMDQLQPFYHYMWQRFSYLQERLLEIDGKMYLLYGKLGHEDDKIILEYADEKNEIIKISDLKKYISLSEDISDIGQPINGDIEAFLKKHLECFVRELIAKKVVKFPKHFNEFVNTQIPKWVDNLILASKYQEEREYIIQNGVIKPVDFNSTGIVQNSTNWSNGLHQFLQLKHHLKLTSETFTTNFLSNMGYFKKYGNNLFGLTGTLGSKKCTDVLKDVYGVDHVHIPTMKQKQYIELPTKVAKNKKIWLEEVCNSALFEASKGRGALIICETIDHAQAIERKLKEEFKYPGVKLYTMNNMGQEREIAKVSAGEIIVSTNLAGRGTDINTDAIEANGGLHVIITMPCEERVEKQAYGRTSRQGKCGTGESIFNEEDLYGYDNTDPKMVKETRARIEAERLEEFCKTHMKIIQVKDELFAKFCELLDEVRTDIRNKASTWNKFKGLLKDMPPSVLEICTLAAIEEQWAMFLNKIDDGIIKIALAGRAYSEFSSVVMREYEAGTVIKNPYYHIAIANDYVVNDSMFDRKHEEAKRHFEKAVELDKDFSAAAYAGKAWLILLYREKFYHVSERINLDCEKKAVAEFEKAQKLLHEEKSALQAMLGLLQQQNVDMDSDLCKQIIEKMSILGQYANSVDQAIGIIHKSQRLIDVTLSDTYQSRTEYQTVGESEVRREDYSLDLYRKEATIYHKERDSTTKKVEKPELGRAIYPKFQVSFYDLTVFEDCGAQDQAVKTIDAAFTPGGGVFSGPILDSKKYKDITIAIGGFTAERLKSILSLDIEILGAPRENAIAELEGKSSFLHRWLPDKIAPNSYRIDLEVIVDEEVVERKFTIQVSKALEIIKSRKEATSFNLHLKDANEFAKFLHANILGKSSINVEFIGLDHDSLHTKLALINAETVDLEIKGNKAKLAQIFYTLRSLESHAREHKIKIISDHSGNYETVYTHEAAKRIRAIGNEEFTVVIEHLTLGDASKISSIGECLKASFNKIHFDFRNPKKSFDGFTDERVNLSFAELNQQQADHLIKYLRKDNLEFSIGFQDLSKSQFDKVVEKAHLDKEPVKVTKVKTINELYMDQSKPVLELFEFVAKGMEYLLQLSEEKFVPWRSIAAVTALAAVQMAAGAVCVATGFGATVGMSLITEGAADLITAARTYNSRQFSWDSFTKQKAVSIVISISTMGLAALKDAGKGIKNLASGLSQEALEQAGTMAISNGKTIAKTLVESAKTLKSLAGKQVMVTVAEAGGREVLNKVVDTISHMGLEQLKPQISGAIQLKVRAKFYESELVVLIKKILTIDKISKTETLKGQIDQAVLKVINPDSSYMAKQWETIGAPLCKGILSSAQKYGGAFSMSFRIAGTLNGIHQIGTMVEKIYHKILTKLKQMDKETLSIPRLLQKYCGVTKDDTEEVVSLLHDRGIVDADNAIRAEIFSSIHSHDSISFGKYSKYKSQILKFFKSLYDGMAIAPSENFYLSKIMKSVSDMITEQCIKVTESQLISPWSGLAVAGFTNKLSAKIQDKIIRGEISGERDALQAELDKLTGRSDLSPDEIGKMKEISATLQEKTMLVTTKTLTYSGLIMHSAKAYTIAYSQCEMIHFSKLQSTLPSKPPSKEVKAYVDKLRKDKPADIADMFAMAAANGLNIKIVEEGYIPTERDKSDGIKIVVFKKGLTVAGTDMVGHYQIMDYNGDARDARPVGEVGINDCGFAVFSELTGSSIAKLRGEAAETVERNADNFEHVEDAQSWVQSRYPQEANSLLFRGGIDLKTLNKIILDQLEMSKERISQYVSKFSFIPPEIKSEILKKFNTLTNPRDILKAKIIFYIIQSCEKDLPGKGIEIVNGGHCVIEDNGQIYELLMKTRMMKPRTSSHHSDDKPKSDASWQVGDLFPEFLIGRTTNKTWFQLEKSPIVGDAKDNIFKAIIFWNPLMLIVTSIASLVPESDALEIHKEEAGNVQDALSHTGDYIRHKAFKVNVSNWGTSSHIEGADTQLKFVLTGEVQEHDLLE